MDEKLDVITGAKAIGAYTGLPVKRVFDLVASGGIPTFKIGRTVAARKSKLAAWMEALENGAGVAA